MYLIIICLITLPADLKNWDFQKKTKKNNDRIYIKDLKVGRYLAAS